MGVRNTLGSTLTALWWQQDLIGSPSCPSAHFVRQVRLSRKCFALVNDRPRVGSIFDPTNEAVDVRDVGYLKVFILFRIKVDVEAIQPRILLCEYTPVKQRECKSRSFLQAEVLVPFGKRDRYDVLEASVERLE
jgi:hypothetical protein